MSIRDSAKPEIALGGVQEHVHTTDVRSWDKLKVYARQNRKNLTPAEAAL